MHCHTTVAPRPSCSHLTHYTNQHLLDTTELTLCINSHYAVIHIIHQFTLLGNSHYAVITLVTDSRLFLVSATMKTGSHHS